MFRRKQSQDYISRYVSKRETPSFAIEVAFDGGSDNPGQENPKKTNVTARCLKNLILIVLQVRGLEVWIENYGDLEMPSSAWNGINLVEISDDRIFLAISNNLQHVDSNTGVTIWSLVTGNTPIDHIMASKTNKAIIVYNGYYKFKDNNNLGNIASVSLEGKEIWRAPLPSDDDIYANPPYYEQGVLKSASWKGFTCSINEKDGTIINQEFTK